MNNELRWKQRFKNFEKSYEVFQRRLNDYEKDSENESHQMSLIQSFEIIFELSWKTLKDYLENEGVKGATTPKRVIRESFNAELFTECEDWLRSLDERNRTTHVYDEKIMSEVLEFVSNHFYKIVRNLYFELKKEL